MSCNNKISDRCVKKTTALCTTYEGTLADGSSLTESPCLNVQEVIEDINLQIDEITNDINVAGLINDQCITYPVIGDKVTVHSAVYTLNTRVKELMTFVGMQCDGSEVSDCPAIFNHSISCLGLDFCTLVDACGEQPTNLKEVLQLLINSACSNSQ
jgi:hypothetical protein